MGEKPDIVRIVTHVKLLSPVFFPELTGMSSILLRKKKNVHCYFSLHLKEMFLIFLFAGPRPAEVELNFVYVRPFKSFFLGHLY